MRCLAVDFRLVQSDQCVRLLVDVEEFQDAVFQQILEIPDADAELADVSLSEPRDFVVHND